MYYPRVEDNGNTRTMIDTWLGYNHNYKIDRGQFFDMRNLSSDNFPLLSPRKTRPLLKQCHKDPFSQLYTEKYMGLEYSNGNVTYLVNRYEVYQEDNKDKLRYIGVKLVNGSKEYDLSDYMEEPTQWQNIIRMGAYLCIFPAKVYVNTESDGDIGSMESEFTSDSGLRIKYSISTVDGDDYENVTVSAVAPDNPTNGQYWYNITEGSRGLNIWYSSMSMWQPIATTYIRIEVPGADLTEYFEEGDIVFMNTIFPELNNGSQIKCIGDEFIVVTGLIDGNPTDWVQHTALTMKRKLPKLDFVCLDKNRLWGCHYGYDIETGKQINEIYASKLGDFKNWYQYQGIASDSYAATIGVPGQWTGCISYQGYPTFFKENAIFRIYGSYPVEYNINQSNCRGVQIGSERSLAVVDEYLVYKSASDVCVYDGSAPISISDNLGRFPYYYNAVGGGCLNKYRLSMNDEKGDYYHFIYDFAYKIWEREDDIKLRFISASENGQLYGATDTEIYGLGYTDNIAFTDQLIGEEWVSWWAETGDMGFEYPDYKYVSKITIRAYVPHRSELRVEISYDGKPFEVVGTIRGNSDIMSQSMSINPYRCDNFKIKLLGHGDCRVYTMTTTLDMENEDDGYKN